MRNGWEKKRKKKKKKTVSQIGHKAGIEIITPPPQGIGILVFHTQEVTSAAIIGFSKTSRTPWTLRVPISSSHPP